MPKLTREQIVEHIRTINKYHNLGDAVYNVRDRYLPSDPEVNSWESPEVKEYSAAVTALKKDGVLP